jgi:hypothetical protein
MRLLKITMLAITLIVGPVLLESCCLSDCCFESVENTHYNIEDMTMSPTPFPAVMPFPSLPGTAIKLSTVAFHFNIDVAYITALAYRGFGALACEPVLPMSEQTIKSIEITSSSKLGNIETGDPLNDLFQVYLHETNEGQPLDEAINNSYLPYLSFRTNTEVTSASSQSFIFRVTLDDGRLFNLISAKLDLQP